MKPWREIAVPHRDVPEGTFQQSEFAADITAVHSGKATPEYQDATAFYDRTCITGCESAVAAVYAAVQGKAKAARNLAWRPYTLCERKNWADDARASNEVVTSWSAIETAAAEESTQTQGELFA